MIIAEPESSPKFMTDTSLPATDWHAYLQTQGAVFSAGADTAAAEPSSGSAEVLYFERPAEGADRQDGATGATGFVAPLTDLGLISVSGDDAASFLHNQLTNDIEHLDPADVRLAGYCTPKGRLLATMLAWKDAGVDASAGAPAILLALPRALQPAIQKRLQMFVMRAKAKLLDITADKALLGLGGAPAAAVLTAWFPEVPAQPYRHVDNASGTLIRLADGADATPRYLWIAVPSVAVAAWPLLRSKLAAVGGHVWRLGAIEAGVPQITAATQEKFVPQMINFELVGGVSFKKGCYPGQEIVARSQYLGKLKRRAMLATIAVAGDAANDAAIASAGADVFSSTDPTQPCGTIVNAETMQADAGGTVTAGSPATPVRYYKCLVEIKLAALESGTVHAGSANGPALAFGTLPYALADDAA